MSSEIKIVLVVLFTICTIEDLRFKKLRIWELTAGSVIVAGLLVLKGETDFKLLLPGIGLSLIFLVFSIASKGGFGLGDVWLICIAGAGMAFQAFVLMLGIAFVLAAAVSAVIIILKKGGRSTKLPFVPFLFLGFLTQMKT